MTDRTITLLEELERSARRRRPFLLIGLLSIVAGFVIYAIILNQANTRATRQAQEWEEKANALTSLLSATQRALQMRDYDRASELIGVAITRTESLAKSSADISSSPSGQVSASSSPGSGSRAVRTPSRIAPPIAPFDNQAGPAPSPAPASSDLRMRSPSENAQIILTIHNRERALVGVPPMTWNNQIAQEAAADSTDLAARGRLVHAPLRGYTAEILAMGTGYTVDDLIEEWVREKRNLTNGVSPSASQSGNSGPAGHYRLMVGRQYAEIGCGVATDGRSLFLVCRYAPAGNVVG